MFGLPIGLNAAYSATMGALGKRLDPYMGHNFLVEIDGLLTGGFSRVEGLEGAIDTQDRAEGGVNGYTHKILSRTSWPNLVLSHGVTDLDALWGWYEKTSKGIILRKNGSILMLDRERMPVMWWNFIDAIPVRWSGPTFDASQDQVAVVRLELSHRGLTVPGLSQVVSATRMAVQLAKK